ncbi:MAG: hypothetical protein PUC30_00850 [Lachnospiraceae bacterium]|nr:hypothetical protein [Lachnospiraceae bacterium]
MEVWKSVVRELCSLPVFLWLAIEDKRYLGIKKITLAVAAVILLFAGCFGKIGWQLRMGGVAFGIVLLMFCVFSGEALGIADGILVLVCGAAFGLYETMALCFFASLYAGGCSVILLCLRRAGRKSRIPFLPFLLLGYITMRLLSQSV